MSGRPLNTSVKYSFANYLCRRSDPRPEADKVLPLIAAAPAGLNRKQIGGAVDLDPEVLDRLLDGLVQLGAISVSFEDGGRVYRIGPTVSQR